jgi:hypothetical protein
VTIQGDPQTHSTGVPVYTKEDQTEKHKGPLLYYHFKGSWFTILALIVQCWLHLDPGRRHGYTRALTCLHMWMSTPYSVTAQPEMEFWFINLTKHSTRLRHAIHSLFYWWILQKTILFSGINIHTKKSAKQEDSSLSRKAFNRTKKGGKPNKNSTNNYFQEFHLWIRIPVRNGVKCWKHQFLRYGEARA